MGNTENRSGVLALGSSIGLISFRSLHQRIQRFAERNPRTNRRGTKSSRLRFPRRQT